MDVPAVDFVTFLRAAAQRTRECAANLNPCADTGDKVKAAIMERAAEWDACADEMLRLQALWEDWGPLAKALFAVEGKQTPDQAWFDYQNKAQRLIAAMKEGTGS